MSKKIKIMVFEPSKEIIPAKPPIVKEIDSSLESMQKVVGGWIQALYPWDDPIALVCNEEGKLMGLTPNRLLLDDEGTPYDLLVGTFFLVGANPEEEEFSSLSDEYIASFLEEKTYARYLGKLEDHPDVLLRLFGRTK